MYRLHTQKILKDQFLTHQTLCPTQLLFLKTISSLPQYPNTGKPHNEYSEFVHIRDIFMELFYSTPTSLSQTFLDIFSHPHLPHLFVCNIFLYDCILLISFTHL